MGSGCPSAASSCGPGDPPILSDRSCSTSNTFLVAKDGRVQGVRAFTCPHPASATGRRTGPSARGSPLVLIDSRLGWIGASHVTILRPP